VKGETMIIRALILAGALSAAATSAQAQGLTLNLAGGVAFPIGSFGEATTTGWHGLVGIGLTSLMQPIGLRLDVTHYRFESNATGPTSGITSGTLNLSYRLPMTDSPLSPYVSAGAGAYRFDCVGEPGCESDTRFGWNAGIGTRLAVLRLKWFLESRFQAVGNARFVPVTLGLTF
jgi:opacity protein-like surface antigen